MPSERFAMHVLCFVVPKELHPAFAVVRHHLIDEGDDT
jgi:hypothetical protein